MIRINVRSDFSGLFDLARKSNDIISVYALLFCAFSHQYAHLLLLLQQVPCLGALVRPWKKITTNAMCAARSVQSAAVAAKSKYLEE